MKGIDLMLRLAPITLAILLSTVTAQAADTAIPKGRLPDTIKPTAYRIDLTIDPAKKAFGGHTEIDAQLAAPTQTLFLHGNGLRVSKVEVKAGQTSVGAKYSEVEETGVARLDLPKEIPAGKWTLTFDYTADFRTGAEGLFHAEVGGDWYAWTQLEAIDARRMFPGFDQPSFKTPFTVTVTAPKSARVFANAPEASATPSGEQIVHRFAPTKPLPTYLVALGVGPFDVIEGSIPPNEVRKTPLPWRVIATKGQKPRMHLAATETPKLVVMHEKYFGIPYPYEKLDLLGTPLLGGAMENAGLIIQDDTLMLLDADAPMAQLRAYAEVTAHEIAHHWFGDLVTPTWWTDIWLNEAFANWMGKKIGNQWRPDLGIAASELQDAFAAMSTDALGKGRPIRQTITENRQINSAFDEITYQKGGQVLAMFESYLGADKFAEGVRLHLNRHRHGNATADDFFRSLGDAARDPKIVAAMRTFTDQTGVPLVSLVETTQGVTVTQSRYRPLGIAAQSAQTWMIPLCIKAGTTRSCSMFEKSSTVLPPIAGDAPLIPNADGAGYYRFRLDAVNRDKVLAIVPTLPGREALAVADSIWADFSAGTGSFDNVLEGARSLSQHSERLAAIELADRLTGLANAALTPEQTTQYRKVMRAIYGPRLTALGLDPKTGAHRNEPVQKQAMRESLVPIVALEGRDSALRAQLSTAAQAVVDGDLRAADPAFRDTALSVAVQERGVPFMTKLRDALVKSNDPLFRRHAAIALASADKPETAATAAEMAFSPGMQSMESLQVLLYLSRQAASRDAAIAFVNQNFKRVMDAFPGFAKPYLIRMFGGKCSAGDVEKVAAWVKPKLKELGGGELELEQTKERIGLCIALKNAKSAEISAALAKAST
jgi:aminopeptidase N